MVKDPSVEVRDGAATVLRKELGSLQKKYDHLETKYRELIEVNSEQLRRLTELGMSREQYASLAEFGERARKLSAEVARQGSEIAKLRKENESLSARLPPLPKALAAEATGVSMDGKLTIDGLTRKGGK